MPFLWTNGQIMHALKGQQHIAQGKRSDTLGHGLP